MDKPCDAQTLLMVRCRPGNVPDSAFAREWSPIRGNRASAWRPAPYQGYTQIAISDPVLGDQLLTMSKRFFVYILAIRPRGVLYVGVTNDLIRRVGEHKAKDCARAHEEIWRHSLGLLRRYSSILEARAREAVLKRWRRTWKFDLIEKLNPDWHDLTHELAL
jgi:putative endonuclease